MASKEFNAHLFRECFKDCEGADLDKLANVINGINGVLDREVYSRRGRKLNGDYR